MLRCFSSVCALGGVRFLAVVAQRRDTDEPGIYAYECDFGERTWKVVRRSFDVVTRPVPVNRCFDAVGRRRGR